ncbi:MAG: T9SS type A sorting domain-containing protein [Bacteroidetes bacterium]|nr:T9SS type A sorting domain-containing protein [Bacteroidota bacterium]
MYRKIILAISVTAIFSPFIYFSQNYKWVKGYGGAGADVFNAIASDDQKNSISVGSASSAFVIGTNTVTTNGSTDILVAKHDFNGNLSWILSFGSSGADFANGVATDINNNIYVCGAYSGSMVVGTTTLSSNGGLDMMIIKLSPTGVVLNALSYGGIGNDAFNSIAVNSAGDIFAGGSFNNSVTFGSTTVSSAGGKDLIITKFNSSFVNQWVKKTGASADDEVTALSTDLAGNVFVTGKFQNVVVIFPPSVTQVPFPTTTNPGNVLNGGNSGADVFVLKESAATGDFIWAISIWSGNTEASSGICSDNAGNNCYVSGDFNNNSNFGSTSINSNGGADGFLAKFSGSNGSTIFVKPIGGTANETAKRVAYSKNGIAISGNYGSVVSFGNGSNLAPIGGVWDGYIAFYDSLGTCRWAKKAGGSGADFVNGVSISNNKHLFFAGNHASPNFQAIPLPAIATSGNDDAFAGRIDLLPDSVVMCMVSVDTTSTHNVVYWDKSAVDTSVIDSFIIYRASPTFIQVGSKSKNDSSLFRDLIFPTNQNPNNIAHAYKLGTKDAFNNYSPINYQLYHKTCFLTAQNTGTVTTLSWNNYSDNNNPGYVTSYNVFKKPNGVGTWSLLASNIPATGNSITYNDPSPTSNTNTAYYIDMNLASPCFYGAKNSSSETFVTKTRTKSNQTNERQFVTGLRVLVLNSSDIDLYPNPATDVLNFRFAVLTGEEMEIEVRNLLGQIVISKWIISNVKKEHKIEIGNLSTGVYITSVKYLNKTISVKKLIKE